MVDQYERQECIERFHDLKNRIQIKIPFKCPKNHIMYISINLFLR